MADNFNLRTFLSENKLTKNAQLLSEGSDYGYDALMDAVDDFFPLGTPENDELTAAVEKAFHNGEIDVTEFGDDLGAATRAVEDIADSIGLGDEHVNDIEIAQHNTERQYEGKKEAWEEGVEEAIQESRLTANEKRLVEMVQRALGEEHQNADPNVPNDSTDMAIGMMKNGLPEGEEMEQKQPLPKYNSIEELMKEIEHGTNEAAHKYKMDEMKRVYEALESKVSSLEEGENAEHIDQKKVKQMRKDIAALRKAEEKLRKEYDKKFTGKEKKESPKKEKEVVALQEGNFDLRKFLAENKLTTGSRIIKEGVEVGEVILGDTHFTVGEDDPIDDGVIISITKHKQGYFITAEVLDRHGDVKEGYGYGVDFKGNKIEDIYDAEDLD